MSLPRAYRQRLTHSFVVNLDGAATFTQANIDAWVAANPGKIKKNGSLYTIAGKTNGSTFVDVLAGGNGASILDDNNGIRFSINKSLKDFGQEIHFGNGVDSNLLVMRKVQQAGLVADNGVSGLTAYVVVEDNTTELPGNTWSRFRVAVSRV
jgi:hypothetical protein